jgi:sensor domain DACNV-containing protein
MSHWYPHEFAAHICRQLKVEVPERPRENCPGCAILAELLSTCYQASLMREEERPVRFRLIFRDPERFPLGQDPPDGLHRLVFTEPRPCSEDELRRLSPAASFNRSMVGVNLDDTGVPQIWGIVHSGPRWLQEVHGGTQQINPIPDSLIIFVTGPGRISVSVGSTMIAGLRGGQIICAAREVFAANWLREFFAVHRDELWAMHQEARQQFGDSWAPIDPAFPVILGQNLLRRVISLVRNYRHGGTLLVVPTERTEELKGPNPFLNIKYLFRVDDGRRRIHPHIAGIMNEFARVASGSWRETRPLGWSEYLAISDPTLTRMDETLFEMAHFVAELTLVDGAVVLNQRLEVLGFGAEISGGLENVPCLQKALDIEGVSRQPESGKRMGTRHRSAYRLCNALHDALAIVVSQDGQVRFIRWHDGAVTCWDQVATSILDF